MRIKIFTFIHELNKKFAPTGKDANTECRGCHDQQLSQAFFDEIEVVRNSCNEFSTVRERLLSCMKNEKLQSVVDMVELLVPGHSLDVIALIIVSVIQHEGRGPCCQISKLRVFDLLT